MPPIAKASLDRISIKYPKDIFDEQSINTSLVFNKVNNHWTYLYIEVR